jgi:D-glycero-D-manno-heptose 1,7-bisphosphate phosphatase
MSPEKRPAIFLDRDGTLNLEKNYLHHIADWEWIAGARESIRALREAGYCILVVSNQSGIARGMFTAAEVDALHRFVNTELAASGTQIDGFYYCPHHPEFSGDCSCRKPKPGMLLTAAAEHRIDLSHSWMIGDKRIDVEAALAAGVRPLMVRTGHGAEEVKKLASTEFVVSDIQAACHRILQQN